MEDWRKSRAVFWVTMVPPGLWLVLFFLAPMAFVWVLSFGQKTGIVAIDINWTLANYLRAFEPIYLGVFAKSLSIAAVATLVCLVVGYPVAVAIRFAPERWKPLLLLIVVLPLWINILIRTYALIAVFRTRGYVNFTLEWLWDKANVLLGYVGLGEMALLGTQFLPLSMLYSNFAVVMGIVYAFLPFMVLPLYANLEKIDTSLMEASLDLGAGHWRTFFHIVFPLTWFGIISGCVIVFFPALGAFFIPELLGGTNSEMIGNTIERQFKSANNYPFGSALSFLLLYATFAVLALRSWASARSSRALGEMRQDVM